MPRERKSTQQAAQEKGIEIALPRPWAHQMAVLDDPRRFKCVVAGRRWGKALALDTPIPMPSGWTTMGEVRVGDFVFNDTGSPTRVVGATEVMLDHDCFEVEFSSGERIVADADHLWTVWTKRGCGRSSAPRTERAVEWLASRLADGPQPAAAMRRAAKDAGIAQTVLSRTLRLLDVRRVAQRVRPAASRGRGIVWLWRLPALGEAPEGRWGGMCTREAPVVQPLPSQLVAPEQRTVTTAELAELLASSTTKTGAPFVRCCGAFQCDPKDLPVDPYFLGLWLGDGDTRDQAMTTADEEIVEALDAVAAQSGLQARAVRTGRQGNASRVYLTGGQRGGRENALRSGLRAAGVLGNKHIPDPYLRASREQRLALLQGLMDTDGTVDARGVCSFDTTSDRLLHGVRELLWSLGIKPGVTYEKRATLYGKDCGSQYRVSFCADEPVFRLRRKRVRQALTGTDQRHRIRVVSVRPVQSVPVRCIQVAAENGMYLAGRECTPTHNSRTALLACVAGHGGPDHPRKGAAQGGNVWWVAPTYGQASDIWRELKRRLNGAWRDKSEMERRILLPGGGAVTVKSSDNPDLLRGAGLDGAVVDEAASCVPETWYEALRPALSDKKGWAMLIGTPKGQNWFYELFERAKEAEGWAVWHAPSSDSPLMTEAEVEANRREMPPQVFLQEIEAQFVREGGSVFHRQWFRYYREDASRAERVLPDEQGERRVSVAAGSVFVTVDLAISTKTSADYTVFAIWQQTPDGDLLLLDLLRDRIEGPDQLPTLQRFCAGYPVSSIAIESVQYQAAFLQEAVRAGLPARGYKPDRDKISRANLAASRYRGAKVWHRQGAPWLPLLEGELLAFPNAEHDDIVDVCSLACLQASQSWQGISDYYSRIRAAKTTPA